MINASMSSHTSGKQLSDRLLGALKNSLGNMFATDYVQNILMTGEMTEQNIRYAQLYWKRVNQLIPAFIELQKVAYSVAYDDNDRLILGHIANTGPEVFAKFCAQFKRQLGDISDDLKAQPMDEFCADYNLICYREVKRASLLRLLVTQLVGIWIVSETHEYLKHEPQYRPNVLANYHLFLDFDPKMLVNVYKSIIDTKGDHISATEETELMQLAKEMMDLEIKFHLNQ